MAKGKRPILRCRTCGEIAAINMRHHKLALCGAHYLDWFVQRTEITIEKLRMFGRGDRVLVAVSGGKDSLALWDVLHRLGYQADGLYIGLGIDGGIGYSDESLAAIKRFLQTRGDLHLHVVDLQAAYGDTVPGMARTSRRGREKPCSVCGVSKRYVMNRAALEGGYDVVATGHNLDDEAAVLMQNTLHWQTGYLARQSPVLDGSEGLARKVKPLVRWYEREVAAYALLRGIDYQYDECPHAKGAKTILYKELLNRLEAESPGAKYQFLNQFLRAREEGALAFADGDVDADLAPCRVCGQPTVADGLCAFCRLWKLQEDVQILRQAMSSSPTEGS